MSDEQRPVFHHQRRVEFSDTDMAGIVHFASFFRYIEEAEHAFLRSVGLSVHQSLDGMVVGWPRASAKCDFHSPARFGDVLDIAVTIEKLGRKSITYRFDIRVGDRSVATGNTVAVCCRLDDGNQIESIAIPPAMLQKLAG